MLTVKKNIALLMAFLSIAGVQAGIIHVPGDQPTIQYGIDATSEHDTVLVDTGRYVENINFNGNNIVVGSLFLTTGDTSYISRTIIDGDSSGSVVVFENEEDSTTVLTGFTITNGTGRESLIDRNGGGGIHCWRSDPRLSYLIVIGNHAHSGAGLYFVYSNARLENSTISLNGSDDTIAGGGIYCANATNLYVNNCEIMSNICDWEGAGIYALFTRDIELRKCLICNNNGMGGTAISVWNNINFILANVTICNNYASSSVGGIQYKNGNLFIVNSIIWNNPSEYQDWQIAAYDYYGETYFYIFNSLVMNGLDGISAEHATEYSHLGIFDSNPLFVDPDNSVFHLTANSPCIDAGIRILAWEGDTIAYIPPDEYSGRAPDLGAYEFDSDAIHEFPFSTMPDNYSIISIYPNPFNSSTNILIGLSESSKIKLSVFNITGQEVAVLANEQHLPGSFQFTFIANELPGGIYFIHANVPGKMNEVRKVVLLR